MNMVVDTTYGRSRRVEMLANTTKVGMHPFLLKRIRHKGPALISRKHYVKAYFTKGLGHRLPCTKMANFFNPVGIGISEHLLPG